MKRNGKSLFAGFLALLCGAAAGPFAAAAPTEPPVLARALLRYDASDAGTLAFRPGTARVTGWANKGTGANLDASVPAGFSPPELRDGWLEFDDGPVGAKRDLAFPEVSGIGTVFWAVDIVRHESAFLLGHSAAHPFHRGENGEYGSAGAAEGVRNGAFWDNGVRVGDPAAARIPPGPRVISFVAAPGASGLKADSLTCDRGGCGKNRWGGRRLAEVAVFTNRLPDAERQSVERYLTEKWLTSVWKGGGGRWSDAAGWTRRPGTDGWPVLFPAGGRGTVAVDAAVSAPSLAFNGSYVLADAGGSIRLSGPVTVAAGRAAAILAPLSGTLEKRGAGLLAFDPARAACPSCSFEGPVSLNGGTLAADFTFGGDALLTNGVFRLAAAAPGGGAPAPEDAPFRWELVWKDDFDGPALDAGHWSRIPPPGPSSGSPAWIAHMSLSPEVMRFRDGKLVLIGKVNTDTAADPRPYLTGGIQTLGKFTMQGGKLEIRAKLGSARGAWPAFWMLPVDPRPWERYAEIDIMEHLNRDAFVYETIHTHYTLHLGNKTDPLSHTTAAIDRDGFNVYSLEWHPDRIVYAVNGAATFVYPRVEAALPSGQWPFDSPFYLMLDMQLGGDWVGAVHPEDLPVEMEIDWVKFYAGRRGPETTGRFWRTDF